MNYLCTCSLHWQITTTQALTTWQDEPIIKAVLAERVEKDSKGRENYGRNDNRRKDICYTSNCPCYIRNNITRSQYFSAYKMAPEFDMVFADRQAYTKEPAGIG